jgi:hypothetical protein
MRRSLLLLPFENFEILSTKEPSEKHKQRMQTMRLLLLLSPIALGLAVGWLCVAIVRNYKTQQLPQAAPNPAAVRLYKEYLQQVSSHVDWQQLRGEYMLVSIESRRLNKRILHRQRKPRGYSLKDVTKNAVDAAEDAMSVMAANPSQRDSSNKNKPLESESVDTFLDQTIDGIYHIKTQAEAAQRVKNEKQLTDDDILGVDDDIFVDDDVVVTSDEPSAVPTEPGKTSEPTALPTELDETSEPTDSPTELDETSEPSASPMEPNDTSEPTASSTEPDETSEPTNSPTELDETSEPSASPMEPNDTSEPTASSTEPDETSEPTVSPTEESMDPLPPPTEPPSRKQPDDDSVMGPDDDEFIGKPIPVYRYAAGTNCRDTTGVPCAPDNLRELCDKQDGSFSECFEACIPSFCCIHDAPRDTNTEAPNCNTDPRCAEYAYCYIVWWKLHDTIGPATKLRIKQEDDFFDADDAFVTNDNVDFSQEVAFHHFEDSEEIVNAAGGTDLNLIFEDPAYWDAESVMP